MKTKKWIKASMLLIVATLFAACANEDIAQDKKKENGTEAPKGGVVFATNDTKISAKRRFIDEDEFAGAKTRTNIKHTPGQGADAYWTSDDFIWVKDKNGTWQKSTGTTLHDGGTSAEFTLPGNKTDYADGCEVRYTGTWPSATFDTHNWVDFPYSQSRTVANDFSKAGEWGDCGSGVARNTGNPDKFNFTLKHKSSYLCFLPRCENAALAPNIRLKGIKITVTKASSNGNMSFFGLTHSFDGENLTYSGSPYLRDYISVTLPNFPLYTNARQEDNATYLVVPPDTYDFKIEYTIKDPTTNVETIVTDIRTGITLDKGNIYDVTANLIPTKKYYMWDAQQDYWWGHESDQPFSNLGQGQNWPKSQTDDPQRWYNTRKFSGFRYDARTPLFRTLPNANELWWYIMKGNPHWDPSGGSYVTVSSDHLQKVSIGGIWLRKSSAIVAYLKTNEGYPATLTWDKMKEGYGGPGTTATPIASPTDYRTTYANVNMPPILGRPSAAEINDYFFLPALGFFQSGQLFNLGSEGCYWSQSGHVWHPNYACQLRFSQVSFQIYPREGTEGNMVMPFE